MTIMGERVRGQNDETMRAAAKDAARRAAREVRRQADLASERNGSVRVASVAEQEATLERPSAHVSRRGFIGGIGLVAGGVTLASAAVPAHAAEQSSDADAIPPAIGHINHVSLVCSGCRNCQLACVLSHEGVINPQLARNIVHTDVQAGDITNVLYCQQCDDPKCLKACPTGALHVDAETGARVIDQDVCIGCQTCLNACVFAANGQGESRIKFNPETNTCFKCDLCGGDPMCVKLCPIGASMASWVEYPHEIIRPQIDDYVEESTEGAIQGVKFEKDLTGPHAGKAIDTKDWALVATDDGANVVGEITSSDGAELRVRSSANLLDADGNVLATTAEHQWCMTMHEYVPITLEAQLDDPTKVAKVVLHTNISYWVTGVDEEY
ncbi:MAG: 4Fe-4S dicluster domain-containing protein [Coriobacteriales bacterium]|jgi:Fe-S-cluster-containing dehydrogenase component